MTKMVIFYRFASYAGLAIWLLLGLLSIGGIFLGIIGFMVNIVMGIIFFLVGFYLHLKAKTTLSLFCNIIELGNSIKHNTIDSLLERVVLLDLVLILLCLFLGLAILTGAILRIFGEGLPIFG